MARGGNSIEAAGGESSEQGEHKSTNTGLASYVRWVQDMVIENPLDASVGVPVTPRPWSRHAPAFRRPRPLLWGIRQGRDCTAKKHYLLANPVGLDSLWG